MGDRSKLWRSAQRSNASVTNPPSARFCKRSVISRTGRRSVRRLPSLQSRQIAGTRQSTLHGMRHRTLSVATRSLCQRMQPNSSQRSGATWRSPSTESRPSPTRQTSSTAAGRAVVPMGGRGTPSIAGSQLSRSAMLGYVSRETRIDAATLEGSVLTGVTASWHVFDGERGEWPGLYLTFDRAGLLEVTLPGDGSLGLFEGRSQNPSIWASMAR